MAAGPIALHGGDPVRKTFLHLHRASLGPEEEREVVAAMRSGWLTTGPRTAQFEAAFARRVHAGFALGVNSCTAAMHLALLAAKVGPGDEVITSPITFAATANVIVHTGAIPVFADVDPGTLCVDPGAVVGAITERTRAILPVHFAGHSVDMDPILDAARDRGIPVFVDAAHAVETRYRDRPAGSRADAACYSFYATKNITTGEGGMLVTQSATLAEEARVLSQQGLTRGAYGRFGERSFSRYEVARIGWKYNMSDLQAALGLRQLAKIDDFLSRRRALVHRYDEVLSDIAPQLAPLSRQAWCQPAYHLYVVQVDTEELGATRDEVASALAAENIGVGIHFPALHLEPAYASRFGFRPGMLPVAERAAERVLSLPLYPGLTDRDQEDVLTAVRKVVRFFLDRRPTL